MNSLKTEKKVSDSISNNSKVKKFEYGAESPSLDDSAEVINFIGDKSKQKNLKNLQGTKISRTS